MNRKDLWKLFKTAAKKWIENNAPLRAAALTFFIVLPLPSLLLIVETIFAQFSGQTQATQQLIQQITALAGPAVAQLFKQLLESSMSPFTSLWASITVVGFSLAGIIGAFAVLRDSLNAIWQIKVPEKNSFSVRVRRSIGPFILVSSLGLIVIAAEAVATVLFGAITLYSINGTFATIGNVIAHILLSFGLSTLLFAIVYKVIPEARIQWKDVALAAITTGIAFTIINYILGSYLQTFTVTTIIGAAGSLMILLIWIFILNQIVLFGAEVSKVYTTDFSMQPSQKPLESTEKIKELIEKTGEKVETELKGEEVEPMRKKELVLTAEGTKAPATSLKEQQLEGSKIAQTMEPPPQIEASSVEVNIKIKTPNKKTKSEE
jgi:membrane protein